MPQTHIPQCTFLFSVTKQKIVLSHQIKALYKSQIRYKLYQLPQTRLIYIENRTFTLPVDIMRYAYA